MARKTKPVDDKDELLRKARMQSKVCSEYWNDVYLESADDVEFYHGEQWNPEVKEQREAAGRPAMTFNNLPQFLNQVMGDIRQNTPSVQVSAADDIALKTTMITHRNKRLNGAEVRAAQIRQIEYECNALEHYKLAAQHAAEGGFGFLRVYADYCDPRSFNQQIKVERVKNRWAVMLDPSAKEPDFSDANYGFVDDWMDREEFEREHPDASGTTITGEYADIWLRQDKVRVSEYYFRKKRKVNVGMLANGEVFIEGDDGYDEAMAQGFERERKSHVWEVFWARVTHNDVLEGPKRIAGSTIPVVPVIGNRVEGKEREDFLGLFRFAKDPTRAQNFAISAAIEKMGSTPKAPWKITAGQIKGHEAAWAASNQGTPAYLVYNVDPMNPTGEPQRADQVAFTQGDMEMAFLFNDKVKQAVGIYDASLGQRSNETSGVAIARRQQEADNGTFIYPDNLRMAVARVGRIINEWIPVYYDTERTITLRHESGDLDTITINRMTKDGMTGEDKIENDVAAGKYEVVIKAGPGYTTMREQLVAMLMDLYGVAPDLAALTADILVENTDMPGAGRIAKRIRKTLPPGVIDETEMNDDEDDQQAKRQEPPVDPVAQMEAQARMAEAEAKKVKAETDMQIAQLKLETAKADAAGQAMQQQQAGVNMDEQIRSLVAQTIAEIMNGGNGTQPGGAGAGPGNPAAA